MTRRFFVAVCLSLGWGAIFPASASAQREAFFHHFFTLTAALEGTHGDEGPRITAALDDMATALGRWHPTAVALDEQSLDGYLLRGIMLQSKGNADDAAAAFHHAWLLDKSNVTAAYYLARGGGADPSDDVRTARTMLGAAFERLRADPARFRAAPFREIAAIPERTTDSPVLPFSAYTEAYQRMVAGDFATALTEFRRAAAADPLVRTSAAVIRAATALRQDQLPQARSLLQQPDVLRESSEAHRVLALVYWRESDDEKCIQELQTAIRLNPQNERPRVTLFHVLRAVGRDAEAHRVISETAAAFPASARARWWLASDDERLNDFAEARQEFARAAAGAAGGRGQVYAAVGRLSARATDLAGAVDAFQRAIDASPNDPAAHKQLAGVFAQLDRLDEALVEWTAALLIDPQDAQAHAGVGRVWLDTGRYTDAIAMLRRSLELAPDLTDARYALGTALIRVGKKSEGAAELQRVEREQREGLAERRRQMSADVLKEGAELRRRATPGRAP